eukprot:jgi/Bigna1/78321/fgenesh1_pg.54_\
MLKAHSLDQPAFRKLYNYEDGNPTILRNDYVEGGKHLNSQMNISPDVLLNLIKKSGYKPIFNKKIYQNRTDKSNATCGRWVLLRFILQRAKQSIDYNKKKMNEYINDTPTGAFNRLHIQSLHSAMPIDSNSAYATTKRGSGRQFFAERDALKQGLSVLKEDDEKPATEKESIFKGESGYVKMLNQVVDLFEEGNKNKSDEELKIVIERKRDLFNDLKSKYNVFNKNVRVGTFIKNLRASLKKTDTEIDTQKKQVQKEINKNFKDLNLKDKFTYEGKRIDKNGVKKVIQAEVDSFGKKERKQRNTIESNLLKVENYVKDDDSVLPEAKTAINLLKKKKQNEKIDENENKNLKPIAIVKNMDDKPNSKKKTKIELDFHQKFEILPNTNSDKRDVMYIAGASGSVSRLDEDETLDGIKNKNEDKAVQDLIDQVSSMGRLHHKKKDEDGLERKEISNLKKMGSRWVNIPLKSFIKLRF